MYNISFYKKAFFEVCKITVLSILFTSFTAFILFDRLKGEIICRICSSICIYTGSQSTSLRALVFPKNKKKF